MKGTLARIKVDHTVVGYRHIRDAVRARILSGKLRPNKKLPSTHEMAAHWNVNAGTVHAALAELVKEGLLIRQMRKGTFVREQKREERLASVGIYYGIDIWAPNYSFYLQALHKALQTQLEQIDVQVAVCRDPRPSWQHRHAWAELADLARRRRIQAVISLTSEWGRHVWLNRLTVPCVHFTGAKIPNRVDGDVHQQAEIAVRGIVEQGCRSVGLIFPINPGEATPDGSPSAGVEFLETFLDLSRQHGLQIRNPWIRVAPTGTLRAPTGETVQTWCERFGYEQFHELWRLPERPEGLVVLDDTVVRGTITALLEARVQVPEQLKLVFHKNAEVQLLCPLPATFVVFRVTEAAQAAIAMIQRLFAGQPCEPVFLRHRLESVNRKSPG